MAVTKKKKPTTINQKTSETIERARETGKLTFDELDEILPEDATPQQIDDVMVALSDTNVELVDEYKIDSERKTEDSRKAKVAKKAEKASPPESRMKSSGSWPPGSAIARTASPAAVNTPVPFSAA